MVTHQSRRVRPSPASAWCGTLPGEERRRYKLRSSGPIKAAYIGKHPRPEVLIRLARAAHERDRSEGDAEDILMEDEGEGEGEEVGTESDSSRTVVDSSEYHATGKYYKPEFDEVPETCDLEVFGEEPPADDPNDDDTNDDDDSVPMRVLIDFTVYWSETKELVPFDDIYLLDGGPSGISASGFVAAWVQDEEDIGVVEDEEGKRNVMVALTDVIEVNVNHVDHRAGRKDKLDGKVYLRTQYAWYILDTPSPVYVPHYATFWLRQHLFLRLIWSSQEDPSLDQHGFQELLEGEQDEEAEGIIGRSVGFKDFMTKDTQEYIADFLSELCEESDDYNSLLSEVPVVKSVLSKKTRSLNHLRSKPKAGDESSRTIVTYRVRQYAQKLFVQPMQVVGELPSSDNMIACPLATCVHPDNQLMVTWDLNTHMGSKHYRGATIEGVQYKAGDSVIIEPGEDANDCRDKNSKELQSVSSNPLANTKWFGKICYFFEEKGKKMFHVQWYQHGSQILLQETAHSQGLFLINECDNLSIDCIYQKCNLRVLEPSDEEPLPGLDFENNDFFTGLTWDQDDATFMEVSLEEHKAAIAACDSWRPCYSCGLKELEESAARWTPSADGGMSQQDIVYHPMDFVYLRPADSFHALYQVAQIQEFYEDEDQEWYAHLRLFARYSFLAKGTQELADDRRLYMTSKVLSCRPVHLIDGKAYVTHPSHLPDSLDLQDWVKLDDHFYVDLFTDSSDPESLDELSSLPPRVFKTCTECTKEHQACLEEDMSLLKKHGPLRGLELFAGAGGLSTGFNSTGFVQTKWAVEYIPIIASTYKANHSDTVVYNQCSNALLKHAVQTFEGKKPAPLKDRHEKNSKVLPSMPMPGDVDFIYGGPPCQSFSGMNHNKRDDDPRSTMPCNMLSYVEFYRPKFFLLENVRGMVHFKLAHQLEDAANSGSAVKMGVIKFILRALIGLGYQARFKLLQAGQYGSPQNRERVIFWGAKRDVPLPKFPVPTHFFEPTHQINLPTGDKLKPPTRITWVPDEDDAIHHQSAPMPPVTSLDAISDLPQFDWINPHKIFKKTAEDSKEIAERQAQGISQLSAVHDRSSPAGYPGPVSYDSKPLNRYQQLMRKGQNSKAKVQYHYSARWSEKLVERVLNIPLEAGTNHEDLPPELAMTGRKGKAGYRSCFGRIDPDGHFRTALTKVNPAAKGGNVLHPTQKRILTVRECARSQGFPDSYKFLSWQSGISGKINDQLKQIGNAVPIPLGVALGKELGKALVIMWKQLDKIAEEEREASPEAETYESDAY